MIEKKIDEILKIVKSHDARFESIDSRLDGMDSRFDGIDSRLDGIDLRLDGMDLRFDGIDSRLDRLEHNQDDIIEIINYIKDNTVTKEEHRRDFAILQGQIDYIYARV